MQDIEEMVPAIGSSDGWTIAVIELQCRGQSHLHWVMTPSLPSTPCLQQQKNSGGSHVNQT